MSGGSGPQGMQIIRPIIIRKKPPHSMTRLSSNLDQKIGYTKKKILLQYGSLDAKIAYIFFSFSRHIQMIKDVQRENKRQKRNITYCTMALLE